MARLEFIMSQKGSFRHFAECMVLFGSVITRWDNDTQQHQYLIPSTCLNGFKDDDWYYFDPKEVRDMIHEMKNTIKDL